MTRSPDRLTGQRRRAWLWVLAGWLTLAAPLGAVAETSAEPAGEPTRGAPAPAPDPSAAEPWDWHVSVSSGWFGALSGPLRHGPAAHFELLPGGRFGRFGIGLYYRGDRRLGRGSVLAGAVFEAGAARPRLVMTLHAVAGYDSAHQVPVVGAGWRVQLKAIGPLVACSNLTAQLFVDGIDTRLGLGLGLTVGLAR